MEPAEITCARVEEEDLDTRYLAGTLSDEEAEAFEEHYFGCERCWSTVRLGLEVRAATAEAVAGEQPIVPALSAAPGAAEGSGRLTRRRWLPLALAASVAILAVGLWSRADRSPVIPAEPVLRGPTDSILVVASHRGTTMVASWAPTPNADRYGVRLQKNDATLLVDRVIADTSFAIERAALAGAANGERVYWDVRALDALGRTIARSRLIPAVIPATR